MNRYWMAFWAGLAILGGVSLFSLGIHFGQRRVMDKPEMGRALPETKPGVPEIEYTFAENLLTPRFSFAASEPSKGKIVHVAMEEKPHPTVTVEAAPPVAQVTAESSQVRYAVQVAAVQNREEAVKIIERLRAGGDQAYLGPTHFGSKGRWYRVWAGDFADKAEAKSAAANYSKALRAQAFVVTQPVSGASVPRVALEDER